jgi:para-nitrobenzyl esterase
MTGTGPLVKVSAGLLRGLDVGGVHVFRAVPYARAPVGALRFRPPVECEQWDGIREATEFGAIAPQFPTPLEAMQGRMDLPQSEDCLTLNIWAPPASDGAARPVMVWIHGGAYVNGTGASDWFDGTSFAANHGIVLVTINYRLNVFGYLHLAGIADGEQGAGNCGLLDQIAALRWVGDNIAAFGGDPGNVTVFGESAGAMSVGVILGTPAADGLFQRAILQSGAAVNVTSADDATSVTRDILADLGLSADDDGVAALRQLPTDRILAAYGAVGQRRFSGAAPEELAMLSAPVVDGVVLPQEPMAAIREGASADVAVMIGTDLDEMEVMRLQDESFYGFGDDEVIRRFTKIFGARADEALALYRGLPGDTTANLWTAVDTDRIFLAPAIALAEARGARGVSTWMYLFTWATTAFGGRLGALHTLEIPFVFNTLDRRPAPELTGGPPVAARSLAERMHRTWAEFARNGDPNHDYIPPWPTYESQRRATMIFDNDCLIADDAQRDRRLLWADIAGQAE